MKLGVVSAVFPADWTLEQRFAEAKALGLDGVQLGMDITGDVRVDSTKEEMLAIRALAEKYGLEIPCIMSQLCWSHTMSAEDETMRKKAIELTRKQLELASYLGCESILVLPGVVGAYFIPGLPTVDYDVCYERAMAAMQELKGYAEELKVSIAIENVSNKFLVSPLETRDFIDALESDYVGSFFDVGNALACGYPEQWVKILGNRIKTIHLKDYVESTHSEASLLEGDVNYPAVMEQLRKISYDGWLIAEYVLDENTYVEGNAKIMAAMQKMLAM